jgi:hypothetical protein
MQVSKHGRPSDSPKLIVITDDPQSYPACSRSSSSFANYSQLKKLDASAHPEAIQIPLQILFEADSATGQPGFAIVISTATDLGGCTVQIVAPPLSIHGPFLASSRAKTSCHG